VWWVKLSNMVAAFGGPGKFLQVLGGIGMHRRDILLGGLGLAPTGTASANTNALKAGATFLACATCTAVARA
jgi:hypothetical protein